MKNLTATLCLTIAVILGSAGVSWGDTVYTALDANGNGVRIKHQIENGSRYHRNSVCDNSWDKQYHILKLSGVINKDTAALLERILSKIQICELKSSLRNRKYCFDETRIEKTDATSGRRFYENTWVKYNADHPRCVIRTPRVRLYLSSLGGSLKYGIEIGRIIRKFKVDTFIAGGQRCASACAVLFLGGEERQIEDDGSILFHAPYLKYGKKTDCRDQGQVNILSEYYREMLGAKDGKYLLERTMDFCSKQNGWVLNEDASRIFGIVNQEKFGSFPSTPILENELTELPLRCKNDDGTYFFVYRKKWRGCP